MSGPHAAAGLARIAVSDGRGDLDRILRVAAAAARGGATTVCLREPTVSARDLAEVTRRLLATLRPLGVRLTLSDRLDVALACGADGSQLGFRSLPVADARRIAPRPFLLGVSLHEGDDLEAAARGGADFAWLGPVFDTPSKRSWKAPIGPEGIRAAASRRALPIVAVGGIDAANAREALAAGAAGVAVVRAVFDAPDPEAAMRAFGAPAGAAGRA